jgi:hypothetical protein
MYAIFCSHGRELFLQGFSDEHWVIVGTDVAGDVAQNEETG